MTDDMDLLMAIAIDHNVKITKTDGKEIFCHIDECEGRGDCDDRDDGMFASIMVSIDGEEMGLILWEDEIESIEILDELVDKKSAKQDLYMSPHKCPVCGKYEFSRHDSFDICPECGWEDAYLQEREPDFDGGPNDSMTLNEYKAKYKSGWRPDWLLELISEEEVYTDDGTGKPRIAL